MPIDQRLTRPGIPLHSEFVGGESDTIREIPPEWRAALDLLVEQIPMPWDRPIVPLSDTVLASKAEQQFTSERMMRTTYKPPGVFDLFESYTDRHKQLGVRHKSFHFIGDWPGTVPNPSALTDVETRNFGNKHYEQRVETVPTLWTDESFCEERPIVTPSDFRAKLGENEHCVDAIGQATQPPDPLPIGVIKWCDNNVDFFVHKTCIRQIDLLSLPAEIDNSETNKFKQVEAVHRILETDTTIPALPTSVQDVEFTKLGDGTALEVRKIVPIRFPESKWTRERGIVTPSDFRARLTEKETSSVFAGTAGDPGVPPVGVLKHEEEQLDVFNMRDILRTIDTSTLPATINNKETNRFKQVVAVDRTLELDTTVPMVPTALMDVEFSKLGDGTALEVHKTVSEVFNELTATIEIADLVPEIFKAVIPITSEEFEEIGSTINDPPTLALGDLFREEKRVTEFTRRIRHRGRAGVSYPQVKVASRELGGEKFGGEVLQTLATLNTFANVINPLPDTGLGVTTSRVRDLGNGTWVKETEQWDTATQWSLLHDVKWDREGQTFIAIEKQTVDPSYVSPAPAAYTVEDVQQIDKWHSRRIKTTKDFSAHHDAGSALISYRFHPFKFPGTLDYNRLITYDHREGYRRAAALLCRHTIRTWWINFAAPPTIGPPGSGNQVEVNEIITDTVNVPIFAPNNSTEAQTYPEVLHDDITNTLGAFYPATSPSFTQYYLGNTSSTTGSFGVGTAVYPYGTGYHIGQSVTAGGYSFVVTNIGSAGELYGVIPATTPSGPYIVTSTVNLGNFTVAGGGTLDVIQVNYSVPVPGSAWVGSERVIAATITQTDIPNLWKVVTEAVVMR